MSKAFGGPRQLKLIEKLIFRAPDTGEFLLMAGDPTDNQDGSYSIEVFSQDGKRKWRHTIRTEEV